MFEKKIPFEQACAPYSGMVYRHCLHMLKNPQEAEDAAQDCMLRALRSYGSFRGSGVATWLFRIAHNTCLDILKSARYQRECAVLDSETFGERADPSATPEESYLRSAEAQRLREAILTLPQEQQALLTLFYGENMRYEEMAAATGLRVGTIKSRLSRAKEALRKKWEP